MPDRQTRNLQDALRDERRQLANQAYPGDLAADVIHNDTGRDWFRPAACAALALVALGGILTIALTIGSPNDVSTVADREAPPATPKPSAESESDDAPVPAPPPIQTAKQDDTSPQSPGPSAAIQQASVAPAMIDASLVPFHRINGQLRLTRPSAPDPPSFEAPRRGRLSLTPPSRGAIDRLMRRTLELSPTPTPERTTS